MTATAIDGLSNTGSDPQTTKAPAQYGTTLIDNAINPRTIGITAAVEGTDHTNAMQLRSDFARAMFSPPRRYSGINSGPQMGLLSIYRDGGLPPLEINAIPVDSPQIQQVSDKAFLADMEFYCPYPYFQVQNDTYVALGVSAGFTWPVTFPLAMASFNVQVNVDNPGDVPVPVLLRMYGDSTTTRFINETTQEYIEITGNIPAANYVEINTEFGVKSVEVVLAANPLIRVNAINLLNLAMAQLWWLEPGNNVITYEANVNTSGFAQMYFRPRYAGV